VLGRHDLKTGGYARRISIINRRLSRSSRYDFTQLCFWREQIRDKFKISNFLLALLILDSHVDPREDVSPLFGLAYQSLWNLNLFSLAKIRTSITHETSLICDGSLSGEQPFNRLRTHHHHYPPEMKWK
jgi:hypothetical protein